jgi:hypothetical protein
MTRTRYDTANVPLLVGRLTDAASRISDALEPAAQSARPRRRIAGL